MCCVFLPFVKVSVKPEQHVHFIDDGGGGDDDVGDVGGVDDIVDHQFDERQVCDRFDF